MKSPTNQVRSGMKNTSSAPITNALSVPLRDAKDRDQRSSTAVMRAATGGASDRAATAQNPQPVTGSRKRCTFKPQPHIEGTSVSAPRIRISNARQSHRASVGDIAFGSVAPRALQRQLYCSVMPDRTRSWTAARILVLGAAAAALALAFLPRPLHHSALTAPSPSPRKASLIGSELPSLAAASAWTAGAPLLDSLGGHVVAVAFVSLNIPSSLRVTGALESWHEAYARYGLRVIGIQVPEFAFAAEPRALQSSATRL